MSSIPTKVVLSHPFSGAAYGWFEQFNPCSTIPKLQVPGHPYYKYLYGTDFLNWIDAALTLLLLYEEVVLPPADAFLPHQGVESDYPRYKNPHLRLSSDFEVVKDTVSDFHDRAKEARLDPELSRMLKGIPEISQEQILVSCYQDVFLASQLDCPIICGEERRDITERLAQLSTLSLPEGTRTFMEPTLVSDYVDVSGLTFKASSVEELYDLKSDSLLRDYAKGFLGTLHSSRDSTCSALPDAIEAAMASEGLFGSVSGFLEGTSRVATYAGLIPVAGTAASAVGIAATHAGDAAEAKRRRSQWYEFALHVTRTRQMKELLAKVSELRRSLNDQSTQPRVRP